MHGTRIGSKHTSKFHSLAQGGRKGRREKSKSNSDLSPKHYSTHSNRNLIIHSHCILCRTTGFTNLVFPGVKISVDEEQMEMRRVRDRVDSDWKKKELKIQSRSLSFSSCEHA
jgi:hypothetical protein